MSASSESELSASTSCAAPSTSREQVTWARPFTELFAANNMNTFSPPRDSSCGREAASTAGLTAELESQQATSEQSAITMQDLIDTIVEESLKHPVTESNYLRASETMFQKMLNGERSWNINNCATDPNFDYQSRLDNLSVLNNLLMSMEMGPKSDSDPGADLISQMMMNNSSSSASSRVSSAGSSHQTMMMPGPSHGIQRPYLQPHRKGQRDKRHHNSAHHHHHPMHHHGNHHHHHHHQQQVGRPQHEKHEIKPVESDSSTSSGERSPESASDSASSLCDNCNNMKLGEQSASASEESPSSGSQSTDSRNSSPSNKTEEGVLSDAQNSLPPMPPLIEVTQSASMHEQMGSAVSSGSNGNSPREEAKHPKKRMRDRHFRETRNSSSGSLSNSDSGGSSSSENGAAPRYTPNFPVFPNVPITAACFPNVTQTAHPAPQMDLSSGNFSQQYLDSVFVRHQMQGAPAQISIVHQVPGCTTASYNNNLLYTPTFQGAQITEAPQTAPSFAQVTSAEPTTIYEHLQRVAASASQTPTIPTCYAGGSSHRVNNQPNLYMQSNLDSNSFVPTNMGVSPVVTRSSGI